MNEQPEEQAALYVFGLLEGNAAAAFERRLRSDTKLSELVDRLDEAAAALAHCAPPRELPPELRARILSQIRRGKGAPFLRRRAWIPWAIAACLALSCTYLISERSRLRHRIAHLEQRDLLAQIRIVTLHSRLADAPQAQAVVLWDEKRQRGLLEIAALPNNAADREYQLWMIDPRSTNPVSAGAFHVINNEPLRLEFQPNSPLRGVKEFMISLERKGGAAKPEGPTVLRGR